MMKTTILFLGLILAGTWGAAAQISEQTGYSLSVLTDKPDAVYKKGETVTFLVSVLKEGKALPDGKVSWSLTKDGVDPATSGEAVIQEGVAKIQGNLAEPGFLQCKVGFKLDAVSIRGIGGAAVDPLSIPASLPPPDGLDAFWTAKKQEIAKVPLNATMTALPTTVPGIELFDVQADAIGDNPMRGCFARPIGAKPKSLPAIISFEGAGVYSTRMDPWLTNYAKDGFLSLEVNAHGLPNGKPAEFYQELERGGLKDYHLRGSTSRDTYYFLHMYLRDLQGVNFLASQPEWDGRILISNGISQGAAQAIFVAAVDKRVTFLMAGVPAMCDHSGMIAGRVVGWPRLVPNGADGKPDPAILETSRYFDSVNFATRVKVPAVFVAGFLDQITPPTSVYAAYNNLGGQKEMIPAIHSPHKLGPEFIEEMRKRVLLHAGKQTP